MRVVILKGKVSIGYFVRDIFEGCSEDYMYLFLFSILDTFVPVHGSCDHFDIHCTYFQIGRAHV